MLITSITYNKIITVITEDTSTSVSTVKSVKVSGLKDIISDLECFSIKLNKTVTRKTVKLIESLGFDIHSDDSYGFDWETMIVCTK
jgi:hypothetical protein